MGCNLKDLAKAEAIDLRELKGQTVGVDAFLVAFQFLTTMRDRSEGGDGGPLKSKNGKITAHLMGFLNRTTTLIERGIKPVFIFDGEHPELKAEVIQERKKRRIKAEEEWKQALEDGDFVTAQKMAQRAVRYTPEMQEETKEMLDLLGVPWINAAAEGEGQAAVMAEKGQLDAVATQDWDALLYGSPILIRNLMSDGSKRYGRVVRAEKITLANLLEDNGISREQLVDLAIMIGTDFHPGIKGVGPKIGLKLIKEYGSIEDICAAKEKELPEQLGVIRQIFLNHPITEGHDLTLNPVNEDALVAWLQDRDFSEGRIERNLKRLSKTEQVRKVGQSSLFEF